MKHETRRLTAILLGDRGKGYAVGAPGVPFTVRDGARVPRKALDARTPSPLPEATFRIPAEGEKKKKARRYPFRCRRRSPAPERKPVGKSLVGGKG